MKKKEKIYSDIQKFHDENQRGFIQVPIMIKI